MSKSHYRYVHVQNEGSSELQISHRYFWKWKCRAMWNWILITGYWLFESLVPRRLIQMNVSRETFNRVFYRESFINKRKSFWDMNQVYEELENRKICNPCDLLETFQVWQEGLFCWNRERFWRWWRFHFIQATPTAKMQERLWQEPWFTKSHRMVGGGPLQRNRPLSGLSIGLQPIKTIEL